MAGARKGAEVSVDHYEPTDWRVRAADLAGKLRLTEAEVTALNEMLYEFSERALIAEARIAELEGALREMRAQAESAYDGHWVIRAVDAALTDKETPNG